MNVSAFRGKFSVNCCKKLKQENIHIAIDTAGYTLNNPEEIIKNKIKTYELIINKLELLNPLGILKKGYSVVILNGKALTSSKSVKIGDNIDIRLNEGNITAEVKFKEEK